MTIDAIAVDSSSVGDPARFRTLADLERGLAGLAPAPVDRGRLVRIVQRVEGGRRELPDRSRLSPEIGVPGDSWGRRPRRTQDTQITAMQADVAKLIANGQPLTLFGDNLILELDLSVRNLPVGSRLRIGGAVLEVTPVPHNGCAKFQARFGQEALRFVSVKELRHRNPRGIYLRVVEPGDVRPGDAVQVLTRALV